MKDILKTMIVSGTALAMLALSSVSASAGCFDHTHVGYGRDLPGYAEAQAVANWNAQVKAHDGAAFATRTTFDVSSCKVYDASLKLYSCTIVARPCGKTSFDLKKAGKLPLFKP
jgi:hypothetical protein